ncbi:MAG TPA: hypothetical protein DHU89_07580 [Flavobacteriales bacterium]|nr:hypothetical protein [Flavobacteriales bacterium]
MENRRVNQKKVSLYKPLILLGLCVLFFLLCKCSISVYSFYELVYFKVIQDVLFAIQHVSGQLGYIILLAVVLIKTLLCFTSKGWKNKLTRLLRGLLYIVSSFFILWGFHYAQPTLEIRANLNAVELEVLLVKQVERINSLRAEMFDLELREFDLTKGLTETLGTNLRKQAEILRSETRSVAYPASFQIKGGLRKMGIAGIYFPFSGEPLYDDSAPVLRKTFTYAHEFFHGRGVTGEDECNYLAYKTLVNSEVALLQYVAHLDALLTLKFLLGKQDKEMGIILNQRTLDDIRFLRKDSKKYRSSFHAVSSVSNDLYLKILSSAEGVEAYNSYVKWIDS